MRANNPEYKLIMECAIECQRAIAAEAARDALRERVATLERENAELRGKALRFDLDAAGIERRDLEAVELVELRSANAELRAEIARLKDAVRSARADEAHCWASRVDGLTDQLREVDARHMALIKAVADGVAKHGDSDGR